MTSSVDTPPPPDRLNVLVFSLLSFCLIGFGLWLVSAGKSYREAYVNKTQGWRVGSSHSVEITLVKEDKPNLACASDRTLAGLNCEYATDGTPRASASADRSQILQPYNTIDNTLLFGAGLWTSADLQGELPAARFSVTCNYNIRGLAKTASIRFSSTAAFSPLQQAVTVGTLTDCVIVR